MEHDFFLNFKPLNLDVFLLYSVLKDSFKSRPFQTSKNLVNGE